MDGLLKIIEESGSEEGKIASFIAFERLCDGTVGH